MIEEAVHWLVELIEALGYPGVFLMSALESTFLPIPSEATLIPAGYLVHQGTWSGPLVFLLASSGLVMAQRTYGPLLCNACLGIAALLAVFLRPWSAQVAELEDRHTR